MSKRQPKDVWKQLVDEVGEEEIERAASVSVEQAEAELAAAGFDVPAERAKANAFLDALAGTAESTTAVVAVAQEEETPRRAQRDGSRPRPAAVWLAAAATVTVAGGVLYAALHHGAPPTAVSPEPTPTTPPSVPQPLPDLVAAAELRRQASAACDARQWSVCLAHLDEARAADPDGDEAPAVKATRERAVRGIREKPNP
jgi:hypothetical protein